MSTPVPIELRPLGKTLSALPGTSLQDLLFPLGVEFPCGGRGRCKGCRVRLLAGELPATSDDTRFLSPSEVADGWRLSCRARVTGPLVLELAQWEATILTDETAFSFTPRPGLGIAVDLGTTTLVAQLLDLETGTVLGARMALNQQAKHGADIMSRIDFALSAGGQATLESVIRQQVGGLVHDLLRDAPAPAPLESIVIVGNTVMHHLFSGPSVEPLSHHPFHPDDDGLQVFRAAELDWPLPGNPAVLFLPCLGGFVGSDILAGILATGVHQSDELIGLVDLGTNGEIVIGNRHRLLCASTAAGPAFEGARISHGMRAATGAIVEVTVAQGQLACRVLGHTDPRGICGSGLVDAVAAALDLGWILPSGRIDGRPSILLQEPVSLSQTDVRELQLAKGAIAAGIRLLLEQWGARKEDLRCLHLAGAFGNYISRASARRIGLLDFPLDRVRPAGNTALLGAKLALFDLAQQGGSYAHILERTSHSSLNEDPHFHEIYVEEMQFPKSSPDTITT